MRESLTSQEIEALVFNTLTSNRGMWDYPDSVQLKSRDKTPWLISTARTSSAEDSPKTPATSATVAAPRNALRRCERAASSGVSGAGAVPDSTGVSPSGACRAILLPAIADATLVTRAHRAGCS